MRITRIVIGTAAILLAATSGLAQDRRPIPRGEMDKYVISAKAGVVNIVVGDVRVVRAQPSAVPEMLISGDELQNGDVVKTGTSGRAEILLNPGCYLRLGTESEFVFLFDNFVSDRLKLMRGSAVLEASAIETSIIVETPKARFEIARDGLYRFNVGPDDNADVAVRKGRVSVGKTIIKEGKRAFVEGSTSAIAKLNKQDVDPLDDWSKERSKALIAANSRLSNTGMSRTLGMSSCATPGSMIRFAVAIHSCRSSAVSPRRTAGITRSAIRTATTIVRAITTAAGPVVAGTAVEPTVAVAVPAVAVVDL